VSGDGACFRPFQDRARLDFEVLGGLIRREPFGFHVENSIPVLPNTKECISVRSVLETAETRVKITKIENIVVCVNLWAAAGE
jgi:hypothetical protein